MGSSSVRGRHHREPIGLHVAPTFLHVYILPEGVPLRPGCTRRRRRHFIPLRRQYLSKRDKNSPPMDCASSTLSYLTLAPSFSLIHISSPPKRHPTASFRQQTPNHRLQTATATTTTTRRTVIEVPLRMRKIQEERKSLI